LEIGLNEEKMNILIFVELIVLFVCQVILTAVTWWAVGASASFDHTGAIVLGSIYMVASIFLPLCIYEMQSNTVTVRALLLAVCGFAVVVLWLVFASSGFPVLFAAISQTFMTIIYAVVVLKAWNAWQQQRQGLQTF
jgi:hypothetical protein